MKLHTRFILLSAVLFLLFGIVIFQYSNFQKRSFANLFKQWSEERSFNFEQVVELKGKFLEAFVIDYTFWDEMADFVQKKDLAWAESNIKEGANLFDTNIVWVYNLDFDCIYSTTCNLKDEECNPLPLAKEELNEIFQNGRRYCHFFLFIKDGLFEVRGATIHRVKDPKRKGPPEGYLFAAKLWDQSYIDSLAKLTRSQIKLVSQEETTSFYKPTINILRFFRSLNSWDERPIAYLEVKIKAPFILNLMNMLSQNFFLFVIFFTLIYTLFVSAIFFWVNLPLWSFEKTLSKEDISYINRFKDKNDEFGKLARLVIDALKNKNVLLKELFQQRKIEESLRESERYYRLLTENAKDIIWTTDLALRFTYVSPSCRNVLGYEPNELINQNAIKILKPVDIIKIGKLLKMELQNELLPNKDVDRSVRLELEHIRKDGVTIYCEIVASFVRDENGNPTGVLGVTRDITERKKNEEDLISANNRLKQLQEQLIQVAKLEAIGRLASGIAHEVRNPLGIILQSVNYLEEKMDSTNQEIFKMIKDNIKRADSIIRSLVDFSKSTKLSLSAEDINPILERSLSLIQPKVKFEGIEIIKELQPNLPMVLVDRIKMEQVFINLLVNAVEAMPQGGKIFLRTYEKNLAELKLCKGDTLYSHFESGEKAVIVEVEDTGMGIPEENFKKIFEPFFTTKGPERGTGLGLSVAKNIIDMHKGLIEVKSKVGEGTRIVIVLKKAENMNPGLSI